MPRLFAVLALAASVTTAHAGSIDDVRQLRDAVHAANAQGTGVRLNGVSTNLALEILADQVIALSERPVERTCFQFNLAVNQNLDAATVETIRQSFKEVIEKIEAACQAALK
jgi:hypothetical protein